MTLIFYIYIINRGWVHAIRFDVFQPCSFHFYFYFMVSSNNSKKNNLILYDYLYEIIGVNTLQNKKFYHSYWQIIIKYLVLSRNIVDMSFKSS